MNLVEAEATGPIEGDAPLVTPPRPLHRRVSVSLLFTLTVLTTTVVAIYVRFPSRTSVLMHEAVERHRDVAPAWDIVHPTGPELRAWALGVVGKEPPLPKPTAVIGAYDTEVLGRRAAIIQVAIDGEPITYLVQRTPVVSPKLAEHSEGELHAVAWRIGEFTCVAVGAEASFARWSSAVR